MNRAGSCRASVATITASLDPASPAEYTRSSPIPSPTLPRVAASAFSIARRLAGLLTVPRLLPLAGPVGMRSHRLMTVALRVMAINGSSVLMPMLFGVPSTNINRTFWLLFSKSTPSWLRPTASTIFFTCSVRAWGRAISLPKQVVSRRSRARSSVRSRGKP